MQLQVKDGDTPICSSLAGILCELFSRVTVFRTALISFVIRLHSVLLVLARDRSCASCRNSWAFKPALRCVTPPSIVVVETFTC